MSSKLLPSEYVSDDEKLSKKNRSPMIGITNKLWISETKSKGSGSSGSSWSDLSSEMGSTETGSDEDHHQDDGGDDDGDFIAQLTRQMADYMLEGEVDGKGGSSCGSNNLEVYKVENQPSPKDISGYYSRVGGRVKWSGLTQPANHDVHSPVVAVQNQMHVQQNKNNKQQGRTWPPHEQRRQKQHKQQQQQQRFPVVPGSAMKAVFLGDNGSKSTSNGTGVFLPRATGNPITEVTRKKRGCPTVLIPARVLHALQVHFEDMNKRSQSITSPQSSNVKGPSRQPQEDVVTTERSELNGRNESPIHLDTSSPTDETSDNQDMDLPPE